MNEARSLSDDLTAAWDQVEENDDDESGINLAGTETVDETLDTQADESVDDNAGDDTGDTDQEPVAAEAKPDGAAEDEAAPRGFTAAAREEWKNTPPAIRKEIAKREADYNRGIEKYRTQAQKADMIDQTITPYRQMFASMGVQPPVLIGQLLQTASILQGGNNAAKAQLVANLTTQFGVDIKELDRALAGEAPSPQSQRDTQLQQELAPIQQELQQLRQFYQQSQQQNQGQVRSELQAFATDPKNEFYADVRLDMADIMDSMAKRGQAITLDQAYDRACYMNPEIRQIISQRQATQALGRKRTASSSVRGTQGGSGGLPTSDSVRGALEAAFEQGGRI